MTHYIDEIAPPNMPRMGNAFTRWVGKTILAVCGWRLTGSLPNEKKLLIIGAPHTSNLDFILAMGAMLSIGLRFSYMMKKEAFFFPLGGLFKAMGGVPIDRSSKNDLTTQMATWFKENDNVWLGITPEGTRSKVETLKKGYWRIAKAADVPLFIVGIDAPRKAIVLDKIWPQTDDEDADNEAIYKYFNSTFTGVIPANQ